MLKWIYMLVTFTTSLARADGLASAVDRSQFQVGRWWLWTYSELDTKKQTWSPWYYERYTVTAADGDRLTLEMSSDDHLPIAKPAHHRIEIDFDDCRRAWAVPGHRHFTVRFYTTSLGGGWQLVSDAHPDLVFTEKFNCQMALPAPQMATGQLSISGVDAATFGFRGVDSFYFLNEPGLAGVAATKFFEPRNNYKFELTGRGNSR